MAAQNLVNRLNNNLDFIKETINFLLKNVPNKDYDFEYDDIFTAPGYIEINVNGKIAKIKADSDILDSIITIVNWSLDRELNAHIKGEDI